MRESYFDWSCRCARNAAIGSALKVLIWAVVTILLARMGEYDLALISMFWAGFFTMDMVKDYRIYKFVTSDSQVTFHRKLEAIENDESLTAAEKEKQEEAVWDDYLQKPGFASEK